MIFKVLDVAHWNVLELDIHWVFGLIRVFLNTTPTQNSPSINVEGKDTFLDRL